ncbi:OSJNBa0042F21.10 protein, related [Eimeria brunetti]|uniref:OSJNBa0042F21.10 protein, related n=1 Tax=Eimeria brunetti TaxID=51314 RepID=U6LBB0_9EIME|nr:OSJNBa0042F21.10 protein, related [Eimeria brunetti]
MSRWCSAQTNRSGLERRDGQTNETLSRQLNEERAPSCNALPVTVGAIEQGTAQTINWRPGRMAVAATDVGELGIGPVAEGAMLKAKQFQQCAENGIQSLKQKATKADDDAASVTVHTERDTRENRESSKPPWFPSGPNSTQDDTWRRLVVERKRDLGFQGTHNLKNAKWITMTSSPFAAPDMIIGKKDNSSGKQQYKVVINYQELNAITVSPEYPLPRIQDILDLLHGAKVFSTMDRSKVSIKSAWLLKISTRQHSAHAWGNFMGEQDVPEVQEMPSTLWTRHQFGTSSIEYLGYRIAGDGITPSPAKTKAIGVWPEELENDTQVKQFLGTVNYCKTFMGLAFADMVRPLVELTKRDAPFVWTEKHTAAVKALKHTLVDYTTLQTPDAKKLYVLRTDASGYAVGGILEQNGKPLGFMSMKMSPAEQRYSVYDQELLALTRALQKWRQLLLVATVTAYTDHKALQYLMKMKTTKPIRPRVARWLEFLMDFQDLKVEYRPGENSVVADALSLCPYYQPVEAETLRDAANDTTEAGNCFLVQATDEDLQESQRYTKALTSLQEGEEDRQWKIRVGGSGWYNALQQCNKFSTALRTEL